MNLVDRRIMISAILHSPFEICRRLKTGRSRGPSGSWRVLCVSKRTKSHAARSKLQIRCVAVAHWFGGGLASSSLSFGLSLRRCLHVSGRAVRARDITITWRGAWAQAATCY
jgi:hypothetical protein